MIRSWANYEATSVDWSWLRGAFAHPTIRPSDADGKVHRQGRIMQLEAKLWAPPFGPIPFPITNELRWCPNTAFLWLVHDPEQWPLDHRPTRFTHYRLAPNVWPHSRRWVADSWEELGDDWSDTIRDLCFEWASWADTTQAEWRQIAEDIRSRVRRAVKP